MLLFYMYRTKWVKATKKAKKCLIYVFEIKINRNRKDKSFTLQPVFFKSITILIVA